MKLSVHTGMKIPIRLHPLSGSKISAIMPSMVYTAQGQFRQFDMGLNFVYDPIMFGLWYRGMPIDRNAKDKLNHDALIFMLGLNLKYLEIGYSYDLSISEIGAQSGGSHELSIILQFDGLNPNKVRRKDKFLPCPNYPYFNGEHRN